MASPQFIADGNIGPMLFVTNVGASGDNRVLQAGAGSQIIGISQPEQRQPPWGPLQDGLAAKQGEQLRVFGHGETCMIVLGGTVANGNRLKSNASGQGIATTADGDEYGAIALEAGTTNQQIRVQVMLGQRGA